MSSSSPPDSGKSVSEKPRFSHTCSLLRQYLKEKGTFGDLSLSMTGKGAPGTFWPLANTTTVMNLFPTNEKPVDTPRDVMKPMDLFPHPSRKEDLCKRADSCGAAQKHPWTAPMTIFYAGQVIVFNDLPADKVKEVMMLASKSSSSSGSTPHLAGFRSPNMAQNLMSPGGMVSHNPIHDQIHRPADPIASGDLPIARRASLHRFLEKRRDRITAKLPYAVPTSEATPSKSYEGKPWLGLAAQPTQ